MGKIDKRAEFGYCPVIIEVEGLRKQIGHLIEVRRSEIGDPRRSQAVDKLIRGPYGTRLRDGFKKLNNGG